MKKILLIIFLGSFLFSCSSSNDESNTLISHQFNVYNDYIEDGITNVIIQCKDFSSGELIEKFTIEQINYNSKSQTITTKGNNIAITYEYVVNGIIKKDSRNGLYFSGNNTKTISISGLADNLGSNNSGGSGGSQTSYTCGARTKDGGYCKRKVKGGGRCWQHK
ncbi:hypothetical protein [Dysgonomonas sp. BGC7]|uniref:hypothetical protein n=1 Tax=Dysgonomonas sp. BGC7 TaxID=1658008 RepID=UPI00068278FC|nr:hypothetical protein [Dysgonomonas sp. BGC7]MBD8389668.1 hypothetical protein [Dysgonomonas sp. BGC7]